MNQQKENIDDLLETLVLEDQEETVKLFLAVDEVEPSYHMENWIQNLRSNSQKHRMRVGTLRIAASIFFIIMAIGISSTLGVEAVRHEFLSLFTKTEKEYTEFTLGNESELMKYIENEWKDSYIPGWLPEGYRLDEAYALGTTKFMIFVKGESKISLTQGIENIYLDTEESDLRTVNINNMEGILISKDDRNILCWHNDKIFFSMTSYIEENEMIEIAKKIKKIS